MKRHAVVVVNIGCDELFRHAYPTLERYCRRHALALEVLNRAQLHLQGPGDYAYVNFEKNLVGRLLERYERIVRLDCDILVTPRCPNVFDIVPESGLGVVYEDVGGRAEQRRQQMERVAQTMGGPHWGAERYFNSGVVVASRRHRDAFDLTDRDRDAIRAGDLAGCKEQNLLNWKVRELGLEVHALDFRYNHLSMFSERWNGRARRLESFILHYAGSQRRKSRRMQRDAKKVLAAWGN